MMPLSPGWATHLGVLEHEGSTVEEGDGHLVIRTPDQPDFHWGNFLLVTEAGAVADAGRWVSAFRESFPEAGWVAVGLVGMPTDLGAWTSLGIDVELDDVLTTRNLPRQTPRPDGYRVRRLQGDDWDLRADRAIADNLASGEYEPEGHAEFVRRRTLVTRAMSERGRAAYFGAFAAGDLVADLGIVPCGTIARFQNVGTNAEHRGRGLASHLLGVAARWAAEQGCDEWVIVTEATNAAGRVYRAVGFEPDVGTAQAYRRSSP